jgi:hypothetical protein
MGKCTKDATATCQVAAKDKKLRTSVRDLLAGHRRCGEWSWRRLWFRTWPRSLKRIPREILDERNARGEIDREEYQLRHDVIAGLQIRDTWHGRAQGQDRSTFTLTLLFAVGTVAKIETSVPHVLTWIAALVGVASTMAFLFLIDYVARLLRPVSIMWRVTEDGLRAIESVYPHPIEDQEAKSPQHKLPLADPLFVLYGIDKAMDDLKLQGSVAFGPERTIEQDPIFAFRIIGDIALKALSKAINDPTTAVLAIDEFQTLLRAVGKRHLPDWQICDAAGKLRVFLHTPENFLIQTYTSAQLRPSSLRWTGAYMRAMLKREGRGKAGCDGLRRTLRELGVRFARRKERLSRFALSVSRIPGERDVDCTIWPRGRATRRRKQCRDVPQAKGRRRLLLCFIFPLR